MGKSTRDDAAGGERGAERYAAGTPRGELERIHGELEREPTPLRESIMEAMLATCGERGYRAVSVAQVIERYGGSRTQFYRQFSSKEDCYAAAYEWEADRLVEELEEAGRDAPDWRAGLRAALDELARWCRERPQVAKGLLLEIRVAGGTALAHRRELIERLSRAVDGARRETESRHSPPPPETARFMIGAVESFVGARLASGEDEKIGMEMPEIVRLIVAAYYGREAADAELERSRATAVAASSPEG